MIRPLLLLLALSACASPSPEFFGAQETRLEREGTRFAVFHKGNRAQVIRLDYADRAARERMPELMLSAVEEATGCTPRLSTVRGETAEMRLALKCPQALFPKIPVR